MLAGAIIAFLVLGGIAPFMIVAGASRDLIFAVGIAMYAVIVAFVLYTDSKRTKRAASRRDRPDS
jgi:hypothetical protein